MTASSSSRRAPLSDVTVVTIESYMAVPSASAILADMGARVIKVEPLSGDPMRGMSRRPKLDGPIVEHDLQFDVDNRGKASVALALDTDEGRTLVHKLIQNADIFMCNLLKRRQEKFGLDPTTLREIQPKLVHATLTGYGTTGPEAQRPGYDVTAFFGRSGLYDAMREGDEGIVPQARTAQGDHTTGLAMVGGILAALRQAEAEGSFQAVETSLYEAAVWTQASDFAATVVDGAPLRRRDRHHMLTITANRFPCKGGSWIVLNNPLPASWVPFCKALGTEAWMEDPRFETPKGRYDNMPALVSLVDEVLLTRTRDEWGAIFDEHNIVWGPVLALHETVDDPQAEAIGLFPELEHERYGRYRTVNAPLRFADADVRPRGPSPKLGAQGDQVLSGLGLSAEELAELRSKGVLG